MQLDDEPFGALPDGRTATRFTLRAPAGLTVRLSDYGAILTEVLAPDRAGRLAPVVLGCADLASYLGRHPYLGALVGRVANRIAGASFVLDGQTHRLAANDGPHHLHGGREGFDRRLWQLRGTAVDAAEARVELGYTSPHGEEGYPGTLEVTVACTLTAGSELRLEYEATTDRPTLVNLAHHPYFNLAGAGDVLGHELELAADHYLPCDAERIPTGEVRPVAGTPFDFTRPVAIGARAHLTGLPDGGYDHCFLLRAAPGGLRRAARLRDPGSGRVLEVWTTEPALQLYSGNALDRAPIGALGWRYPKHGGVCLETQRPPDAVHRPHFPPVVLRPGAEHRSATAYRFAAE